MTTPLRAPPRRTLSRRTALGLFVAAGMSACGREGGTAGPKTLTFSILSAQSEASAAPLWQPFLDDMSAAIGATVRPRFGANYADLVAAMDRGAVQLAWFSAQPAISAIDDADAEVLARTVARDGQDSYRAILMTQATSDVTLDRVLACDKALRFGIGDAQSTSGTLAPMTFLFNPRGIDPRECFASVREGNHQENAMAVAAGTLDVATGNTTTLTALARQNPQIAEQVKEIWRSPPIPEGGILARSDLDPAVKERVRGFLLAYGQGDNAEAERQRQILAALNYSQFRAADDAYLDPVREMLADQKLATARVSGDQAALTAAQQELDRLRLKREVQP